MTWIKDSNGNKCSVEYFGSEEAAQKALDSLEDCRDCTNCSDCYRCYRCSRCSGCSRSSGCYNCYRCSRSSGCSGCSGCYNCYRCSRSSGCSRCYNCSGCSGCYRCSRLENARPVEAEVSDAGEFGPPPVPTIPDIHKTVYEASSHPGSLAMENVHTCANTHCRAGWVITLAGEAGRKLEAFFGWELAAMKIYDASASGYSINPTRFYDSNTAALADMKRLAEAE